MLLEHMYERQPPFSSTLTLNRGEVRAHTGKTHGNLRRTGDVTAPWRPHCQAWEQGAELWLEPVTFLMYFSVSPPDFLSFYLKARILALKS